MELSPSIQVEKLPGWDGLSPSDQDTVNAAIKKLHCKQEGMRIKFLGCLVYLC